MEKMDIEKVLKNISMARKEKGSSYGNLADELSLTTAAYRKVEIGKTKLTVERLFRISEILESPLPDLLSFQQKDENFDKEDKEFYEKLLQAKDEQIALLKKLADEKK